MRFMIIVKASKDSEAGVMPSERLLAEMGRFNEELAKAGVLLAGEGLQPSSKGARVRFSGKERTVTDGPFAETKELIAGYWLWQVKSKQEAIDWVKRCPNPHDEECELEIRQIFEADDFGAEFTPELRKQEARVRAQALGLKVPRFEQGREMTVAGISARYSFDTRAKIPEQWQRFAPRMGKVPGQVGKDSYGVCWNVSPGGNFDYLSGVEVGRPTDLPQDLVHLRLAPRAYAVFTHPETVASIGTTIDKIWKEWVPQAGLKIGAAPCFERYTEEFDPKSGKGGMEIWIPLDGEA